MPAQAPIVELADPTTWPPAFSKLVTEEAEAGRLSERWLAGEIRDPQFMDALDGVMLRTYHCTRLTTTEVGWVRDEGLVPLSAELVERKLAQAVTDGHLTDAEVMLYRGRHKGRHRNRTGRIWLVGDRADLANDQVRNFLEIWGGEAINMTYQRRSAECVRLERVGVPTVVATLLDPVTERDYAGPGIGLSAVRRMAGVESGTSVCTTVALGPERIEAIHQPGSQFWDQYVGHSSA
jgi:hypothetical protein